MKHKHEDAEASTEIQNNIAEQVRGEFLDKLTAGSDTGRNHSGIPLLDAINDGQLTSSFAKKISGSGPNNPYVFGAGVLVFLWSLNYRQKHGNS